MRPNKFMSVISILTFIVIMLGSTFAYFAVNVSSSEGAIVGEAATLDIKLEVLPLYSGNVLIPTNDSDIDAAFANECVDIYGAGACNAYTIRITNNGQEMDYVGTINFNLEGITNFKYRVLDENDAVYYDNTVVISGEDQSLGDGFTLADGETKIFKLVVWLPNVNRIQDGEDANGHFSANVTYSSSAGAKVSGMFSI